MPSLSIEDRAYIDALVEPFYLSQFVNTPAANAVADRLRSRFAADADGEYPEAFYDQLTAAYGRLLKRAADLNEPQPVGEGR
jgi:hypothetical protein